MAEADFIIIIATAIALVGVVIVGMIGNAAHRHEDKRRWRAPLVEARRSGGSPRSNGHAANSRPLAKRIGPTTVVASAEAMIGPMPGMLAKRWLAGLLQIPSTKTTLTYVGVRQAMHRYIG